MKKINLIKKIFSTYKNPIQVIKLIRKKSKGFYLLNLRNGLQFLIRRKNRDINVVDEIFIEGIYKEYLIRANLKEDSTIIDVGANIGGFTVYVSKALKKSKVYAVEPSTESYNLLNANVFLNNLSNQVTTIKKAVSDKKGIAFLNLYEGFSEANSIEGIWDYKIENKEEVDTLSLKDLFSEYKINECSLLKLDCEGSEYKILETLDKNTSQKINSIILEYHSGKLDSLINKLKNLGFNVIVKKSTDIAGLIFAIKEK